MSKVLVKVFFPKIDKQYETWIPINKKINSIIILLVKGVNELNDNIYTPETVPILYNRTTGEHYDLNDIVQETNIKNGTELILM